MPEIVHPFLVRYDGRDAEQGVLEGDALGESIQGASRLYTAVAHCTLFGKVPRGRYRREFRCFARPAEPGSWDQWWLIAPVAGDYAIRAQLYNNAISYIFGKVVDSLTRVWTRPTETRDVVAQLTGALTEQARLDTDVQQELARGLIRSNDQLAAANASLADMAFMLGDKIPDLAVATRPYAKRFVRPIGETCSQITQFASTPTESLITESDAEVIRGDPEMEVDPMAEFKVKQISEINIRTGHCVVDVDGFSMPVPGKITDPHLGVPDNVYTRALNDHLPFTVQAKAVRKGADVQRLYISNAAWLT